MQNVTSFQIQVMLMTFQELEEGLKFSSVDPKS